MSRHFVSLRSLPVRSLVSAGILLTSAVSLAGVARGAPPADSDPGRETLMAAAGGARGVCALLGDTRCATAIELARTTEFVIYVQLDGAAPTAEARRAAQAAGFLGTRIVVGEGRAERVHLADNVADVLVALDAASAPSQAEALRAVRPGGSAFLAGRRLIKPVPEGVDDWSHAYHGPDNNPQSLDTVVRAPYLTQFLALPYYAPLPQVTVAAAGRVFRALGHIAFKEREEKWVNTLMAYNGYNGTILWKRPLTPGIMVHRSTLIATPDTLYLGDDRSCKKIDPLSGEIRGEIRPPEGVAGGTFWKWMALEGGVLYALIGEQEMRDPDVRRSNAGRHGWPWNPLSRGFNVERNPWGFGRNLLAMDARSGKVLWRHREEEPMDSRALCMKGGRLYIFRFGSYLAAIDAKDGKVLWRRTAEQDAEVFRALGKDLNRQDWRTNWRTTAYLKSSDHALYFAGPGMDKLIALSTQDGSALWQHPYDNFQLVLRDDGLYGISGPWANNFSRKLDPLTGAVLAEFDIGRRACTRPTGSVDAIFFRANGGSIRFDVASAKAQYVSPMRPNCHDGVTVANGLLYWWPSTCDCQLSLYGATSLGPAGDHDFFAPAREAERLETERTAPGRIAELSESPADWPTFRANNRRTAISKATVPEKARQLWQAKLGHGSVPTAPAAAGGNVFVAASDGAVRAFDAESGALRWTAYTGGAIRVAPTVWKGRALVGSGDGRVYAYEARTGRRLWRFRAAPEDRMIPFYGTLLSRWPAASGVLVEDGVAYVAAGISNFDGTHVFALDAATGAIRWQNHESGHLDREGRTGVGVQGHLLLHGNRLYLAGGNAVSPGIYDVADGRCLNEGDRLNIGESICLRGWELYLVGDAVAVGGQPFYRDPEHPVIDRTVTAKMLHAATGERDIIWLDGRLVECYEPLDRALLSRSVFQREYPGRHIVRPWGRFEPREKPLWRRECPDSVGVAVCDNAVVVLTASEVFALELREGTRLWSQALPASPVAWGLAVDRDGRVLVSLRDGRVACFGARFRRRHGERYRRGHGARAGLEGGGGEGASRRL